MSNISKEKVGIQKLVEAIVKQAVLDVKNCYGTDGEYFLNHYQDTFYNDILPISKDDMKIIIKQTSTRSLKKTPPPVLKT